MPFLTYPPAHDLPAAGDKWLSRTEADNDSYGDFYVSILRSATTAGA